MFAERKEANKNGNIYTHVLDVSTIIYISAFESLVANLLQNLRRSFRPHLHYTVFKSKRYELMPLWPSVYIETFSYSASNKDDFENGTI